MMRLAGTRFTLHRRWSDELPDLLTYLACRFKIQDDRMGRDTLAAWACIRLDRLQRGYRFVHLLDAKGMESSGVLLIKVSKVFL